MVEKDYFSDVTNPEVLNLAQNFAELNQIFLGNFA